MRDAKQSIFFSDRAPKVKMFPQRGAPDAAAVQSETQGLLYNPTAAFHAGVVHYYQSSPLQASIAARTA